MRTLFVVAIVLALLGLSCSRQAQTPADNTLSPQEESQGWRLLFDGTSVKGWRGFNESTLPEWWIAEDGTLKTLGKGGDIGGDIIYADAMFDNFELSLEWKLTKGGNSGIFYHVVEGGQYRAPYENAPEYQVIDDLEFPEPLEAWQQVGADYAMYLPDSGKAVKPAGQWNTSRIVFTAHKVQYFLNGKLTVSFVPWSEDWQARKASGKWKDYPQYGLARTGYIGLQDHGSVIQYKNIKIRRL